MSLFFIEFPLFTVILSVTLPIVPQTFCNSEVANKSIKLIHVKCPHLPSCS